MSSNDEATMGEQPGTTPTLNNLLSKPTPTSEASISSTSDKTQESSMQNGGSGEGERPPGDQKPLPGHLQPFLGHGDQPPGPPPPGQYPPGYPPQFMGPRPGFPPGYPPGYPPHPGGFPPGPVYQYPPGMMRPMPPDLVRMPPGTNPLEWSAMQKKMAESQLQNPGTPASVPAPSPAASSVADDGNDDKSRLDSPSWPGQGQRTPAPGMPPPGMGGPPPGMMMGHPGMHPPGPLPSMPSTAASSGPRKDTIVDKLVGQVTAANPPRVMPERRMFFERLVDFCERQGEPITSVPQVSKQNIDLHRLYIAVRNRGGFEQVTKNKEWKSVCPEANPDLSESSAAGYQLRKHYQKHLLMLECMETGKSADDAIALADKQKRVRRKEPAGAAASAAQQPQHPPPGPTFPHGAAGPMPGPPPAGYLGGPPPDGGQYGQRPPHPGYYGYPPGAYPPGTYPPQMPQGPGQPPGAVQPPTMRQPPPQTTPSNELDTSQANTLQVPQQHMQPGTPSSQTAGPASVQPPTPQMLHAETTGSQAGSRAPSAGPTAGAATPDSCSRMSAGADANTDRPESRATAAATPGSTATPQPQPATSAAGGQQMMPPPHMQMPSTSMATSATPGAPMPPPGPYYGQPAPMYPNGHGRPGGPPGYPGYPPQGYHPGAPTPGHPGAPPGYPSYQPPPNHPSHPSHPQHQQYMQNMWRNYPPGGPMGARPPYGYPPAPRMGPPQPPPGAPSPGASKMRGYPSPMPPQPTQQTPQQPTQPNFPPTGTPASRPTPSMPTYHAPQPTPSSVPAPSSSQVHSIVSSSMLHSHSFPQGSVEATTISQSRRRRPMARDLVNATPRRLIMALRSGLETEAIWAMNALNVLLYDDTNPHPSLGQMPGLLNVLVEHFWATLSILYPEEFPLPSKDKRPFAVKSPEKKTIKELLSKNSERLSAKQLIRTDKKLNSKESRTGRKVCYKDVPMPENLKKSIALMESTSADCIDESLGSSYVEERISHGLGGGLAERVAARLKARLNNEKMEKEPNFSIYQDQKMFDDAVVPSSTSSDEKEVKDEAKEETPQILICRQADQDDIEDNYNEWELSTPKQPGLTEKTEALHQLSMRALSLSNILRGFSFFTGSEPLLCKHHGLLYLLGRFLALNVEENKVIRVKPPPIIIDAPIPEPEPFLVERQKSLRMVESSDCTQLVLQQTSMQLRDDAFTMLCHMSAMLDLSEVSSEMSYPIYDGLLKWCTSKVSDAIDPIPPAHISPRNYCLEVICKMSVVERNVDMLLSTGEWPRIEKFIKNLSKMLTMSEVTENREFAIVILSAFCNASEAVSFVAANDSPVVSNLIAFIEHSDQNMHSIMQSHGMPALRDNPELMGTSVGMLRRAATLLRYLIKIPDAYKVYVKHQQRLLQFTMSQLMDSRVAGLIADTLFEMQSAAGPPVLDKMYAKTEPSTSTSAQKGEDPIVKMECLDEEKSIDSSNDASSENSMSSDQKKLNGGSHSPVRKVAKRANFDEAPSAKRSCLENGFGEKKNGKLDGGGLQLKESRSENSSMAVVA